MNNNPKFEYYYRQTECKAKDARKPDCICWHDEGTGPYKNEKHDDENTVMEWREK